jgi:hypothetical protein
LFRRVHEVDQKLLYVERREAESTRTVSQQIAELTERCRNVDTVIANLELKLARDIEFVEEAVTREVQSEASRHNETDSVLRSLVEEEGTSLRGALQQAYQSRTADVEHRLRTLSEEFSQLCLDVDQHIQRSKEGWETAISKCQQEALRAEDALRAYKLRREEAEMTLLKLLEDTCTQLHQEIVAEREERTQGFKRLERLLLETTGSRSWVRM